MTNLSQKAADAKAIMNASNPSVTPEKLPAERKRIPLSVPQRKLEVPAIPGYWLRWVRGTAQRLAQAERAGYMHVAPEEVELNPVLLGGDASHSGSTDMGSRVSVVEGGETDGSGQAVRMYLMKQLMEHHLEDDKITQDRNDSIADALTASYMQGQVGGVAPGEQRDDVNARYVDPRRTRIPELFKRKVKS